MELGACMRTVHYIKTAERELPVLLREGAPVAEQVDDAVRQDRLLQAVLSPELGANPPRVYPPQAKVGRHKVDKDVNAGACIRQHAHKAMKQTGAE